MLGVVFVDPEGLGSHDAKESRRECGVERCGVGRIGEAEVEGCVGQAIERVRQGSLDDGEGVGPQGGLVCEEGLECGAVPFDGDDGACPSTKRLEPERAGPSEEVEDAEVGEGVREPCRLEVLKERLSDPVGGGSCGGALGCDEGSSSPLSGDDAHVWEG